MVLAMAPRRVPALDHLEFAKAYMMVIKVAHAKNWKMDLEMALAMTFVQILAIWM